MRHKKVKEHHEFSENKTIISIIISSVLVILATFLYRFEVAGKVFYLRYIITFIAAIILFDALSLKYDKKVFHILRNITIGIILFILFILIYYIATIPNT